MKVSKKQSKHKLAEYLLKQEKKASLKEKIENWDDDFDCQAIDFMDLRASSSASSSPDRDLSRKMTETSGINGFVTRESSRSPAKKKFISFNDFKGSDISKNLSNDFANLTLTSGDKKLPDLGDLDDLDEDWGDTITSKKGLQILQKKVENDKLVKFKDSNDEIECDFLIPINPGNMNLRRKASKNVLFSSKLDNAISTLPGSNSIFSSSSSMSTSSSSVTSASTFEGGESESQNVLEGIILPDDSLDFRSILSKKIKEAEEEAKKEYMELQAKQKNFSTLKEKVRKKSQNESWNQEFKNTLVNDEEVEGDWNFFEGFELPKSPETKRGNTYLDELLISNARCLNRNIVIRTPTTTMSQNGFLQTPLRQYGLSSNSADIVASGSSKLKPTRLPRPVNLDSVSSDMFSNKLSSKNNSILESPTKSGLRQNKLRTKQSMPLLRQQRTKDTRHNSIPTKQNLRAISSSGNLDKYNNRSDFLRPKKSGDYSSSSSTESRHMDYDADYENEDVDIFATLRRPKVIRKPRNKQPIFGDGTELDAISTLSTNKILESRYLENLDENGTIKSSKRNIRMTPKLQLESYQEPQGRKRKSRNHTQSPGRGKSRKGIGLIKQLSMPVTTFIDGLNGTMKFNPDTLKWEGNESELQKFDSITTKNPGLISFMSHKGVKIVGKMVFDPEVLCWINMDEAESSDPFEGLDDLDVDTSASLNRIPMSSSKISTGQLQNSSVSSGLLSWTNPIVPTKRAHKVSTEGEFQVGNEFQLSKEYLATLKHEELRWDRKVKNWFIPGETYNRQYIREIRDLVIGDVPI